MSGDKIKLKSDDWAALFPETPFIIGTTTLQLIPLSLSRLARIITRLNLISDQLSTLNIDLGNLSSKDTKGMLALLVIILEHAPSVLTELCGLSEEDLQLLPITTVLNLFTVCVEININSHEGLLKNFNRLGEKVVQLMKVTQLP